MMMQTMQAFRPAEHAPHAQLPPIAAAAPPNPVAYRGVGDMSETDLLNAFAAAFRAKTNVDITDHIDGLIAEDLTLDLLASADLNDLNEILGVELSMGKRLAFRKLALEFLAA